MAKDSPCWISILLIHLKIEIFQFLDGTSAHNFLHKLQVPKNIKEKCIAKTGIGSLGF